MSLDAQEKKSRFLEAPLVRREAKTDGELKNVRLFGVMTNTSVLSDKNVPLNECKEQMEKKTG